MKITVKDMQELRKQFEKETYLKATKFINVTKSVVFKKEYTEWLEAKVEELKDEIRVQMELANTSQS